MWVTTHQAPRFQNLQFQTPRFHNLQVHAHVREESLDSSGTYMSFAINFQSHVPPKCGSAVGEVEAVPL